MKIEEILVEFGRLKRLVAGISTTFSQLCPMSLNLSSVQDEVLLHIYDWRHHGQNFRSNASGRNMVQD